MLKICTKQSALDYQIRLPRHRLPVLRPLQHRPCGGSLVRHLEVGAEGQKGVDAKAKFLEIEYMLEPLVENILALYVRTKFWSQEFGILHSYSVFALSYRMISQSSNSFWN